MTCDEFLQLYGYDPDMPDADFGAGSSVLGVRAARALRGGVDGLFGRAASRPARFRVIGGGTDVELGFGRYKGRRVSEIAGDPDGRRYLVEFVLRGAFPEPLKEAIRKVAQLGA